MTIFWLAAVLTPLAVLADTGPAVGPLLLIAIANAVVWVGLFLFLLWRLMRGSRQIDEQISKLEAATPEDKDTAVR